MLAKYFLLCADTDYYSVGNARGALKLAKAEIKRQLRVTVRAWRRLMLRRIKPTTAIRLCGRSCWKITLLLSRLSLLVIGGSVVALLVVSARLITKLRGFRSG